MQIKWFVFVSCWLFGRILRYFILGMIFFLSIDWILLYQNRHEIYNRGFIFVIFYVHIFYLFNVQTVVRHTVFTKMSFYTVPES